MVQAVQAILRRPQVERLTGLRRSSLYALVQAGKFPRPIKLSEKAVGWLELEIVDWQQRRVAERDAGIVAPRRRRRRRKVEGWPK